MRETEQPGDESREKWTPVASEFNLSRLGHLEGDGVNIQCVNSSEFVVGKQMNFNGPVTIINSPDAGPGKEPEEEKIVIKNKILSESAVVTLEKMAKGADAQKRKFRVKIWPIVLFAVIASAAAAVVSLAVFSGKQELVDPGEDLPRCERLSRSVCLYAEFPFARESNDARPFTAPAPYVVISQTRGDFCFNIEECLDGVKAWFEKGTACNFLVGGDGNVYRDLGWNEEAPLGALHVCFMGDYAGWEIPTYPQVMAAKTLIEYAVESGRLADDYVLLPSNATSRGDLGSIFGIPPGNSTRHRFYSKTDWGGKPAKSFVLMKLPVPYVVVSHSVSSRCFSLATCSPLIQGIQNYHQSISYADVAYNFLVDSSGNAYEGRGWVSRNVKGGFTNGRNVDVCLIGDFSESGHPSDEQMDGLRHLLELGLDNGYLPADYSLIAANATYATLSPGKNVYDVIKDWPHFDPDPASHVKDFEE